MAGPAAVADPEVVAGPVLAGPGAGVAAPRAVLEDTGTVYLIAEAVSEEAPVAPLFAAAPLAVVPELPVHPATGATLSSSAAASRRARHERVSRARHERVSRAGMLLSRIWSPSGPDPLGRAAISLTRNAAERAHLIRARAGPG